MKSLFLLGALFFQSAFAVEGPVLSFINDIGGTHATNHVVCMANADITSNDVLYKDIKFAFMASSLSGCEGLGGCAAPSLSFSEPYDLKGKIPKNIVPYFFEDATVYDKSAEAMGNPENLSYIATPKADYSGHRLNVYLYNRFDKKIDPLAILKGTSSDQEVYRLFSFDVDYSQKNIPEIIFNSAHPFFSNFNFKKVFCSLNIQLTSPFAVLNYPALDMSNIGTSDDKLKAIDTIKKELKQKHQDSYTHYWSRTKYAKYVAAQIEKSNLEFSNFVNTGLALAYEEASADQLLFDIKSGNYFEEFKIIKNKIMRKQISHLAYSAQLIPTMDEVNLGESADSVYGIVFDTSYDSILNNASSAEKLDMMLHLFYTQGDTKIVRRIFDKFSKDSINSSIAKAYVVEMRDNFLKGYLPFMLEKDVEELFTVYGGIGN